MSIDRIIELKVSEINAENRLREDYQDIDDLMESIEKHGQDIPIVVDQNMRLVAGGRRFEAHRRLKKETIRAIVRDLTDDEAMALEIRENTKRCGFTFIEKVKITKILQSKFGERRGRIKNSQGVKSEEDKNPQNSALLFGEETRDYIAKEVGWGSHDTMSKALTIANNTKEYVHDALNKGLYSINYAYRIATAPKGKQQTMHNDAILDPSTNTKEFNKAQTERRKAKRKKKTKTPTTHKPHPIYNIIRIAPDWDNVVLSDIQELPIDDYAHPDMAVVVVEGYARDLPKIVECIDTWGFEFSTIITAYNPKRVADHLQYTQSDTAHLVMATRGIINFKALHKVPPVVDQFAEPLVQRMLHVIGNLFPNKLDRRIDLTSTEPVKSFVVWKLTYGDPDALVNDDELPDNITDDTDDKPEFEQIEMFENDDIDLVSDDAVFESEGEAADDDDDISIFDEGL